MNDNTTSEITRRAFAPRRLLVIGALLAVTGGGAATYAAASSPHTGGCIRLNSGGYNACNVGPQAQPAARSTVVNTPDRCIRMNGGDYNACNVGNTGRGDWPYAPAH